MKAINLTGKAPTERRPLIDMLPLDTPLVIQIFPVYACQLKCNYCIFQKPEKERHFISDTKVMSYKKFQFLVDDMKGFPSKIKLIRFVGIGEPLLHADIARMVFDCKLNGICEKTEIITNAINLNNYMSDALIFAGLDRLVISVQGTSAAKYKEVANFDINFDKFIEQIKYFYEEKENTHVYIKIVDSAVDDEQKFYDIFGDICDSIAIESTVPIHAGIDLPERDKTQFGEDLIDCEVCPQPFCHMQINADFNVVPCYSFEYPEILGNANQENIVKIWNGDKLRKFRKDFFYGTSNKTCKECKIQKYRMHSEDKLDVEKLSYIMF